MRYEITKILTNIWLYLEADGIVDIIYLYRLQDITRYQLKSWIFQSASHLYTLTVVGENTALRLYVEGKDAETIRRWKDCEKSLGISGTDSAFGSDME